MSVTLKDQIVATTNTDLQGEKLSREELYRCFMQIPNNWHLHQEHDPSAPPVAKATNKNFVELSSGEYAITLDIEIFDEKNLKKYKGFSIGYTKNGYVEHIDTTAEIIISLNPRVFNSEDFQALTQLTESHKIAFLELHEKSKEVELAKIIIKFVSGAVAAGFFGQLGADKYTELKNKLKSLKSNRAKETIIQLRLPIEINGGMVDLLVLVNSKGLDTIKDQNLGAKYCEYIKAIVGAKKIKTASIKITETFPYLDYLYYIDCDDNLIVKQ